MKRARERAQREAHLDWCRYGRPWRKTTCFAGRGEWLRDLSARCLGDRAHQELRGAAAAEAA
eukprot:7819983-Lingulodinium_polyedra.AAC.1